MSIAFPYQDMLLFPILSFPRLHSQTKNREHKGGCTDLLVADGVMAEISEGGYCCQDR